MNHEEYYYRLNLLREGKNMFALLDTDLFNKKETNEEKPELCHQ